MDLENQNRRLQEELQEAEAQTDRVKKQLDSTVAQLKSCEADLQKEKQASTARDSHCSKQLKQMSENISRTNVSL